MPVFIFSAGFRGFLLLFVALQCVGCDRETETKNSKGIDTVALYASIAASSVYAADKACKIVGVDNEEACRQIRGTLPDEQKAKILADASFNAVKMFSKSCTDSNTGDYCVQLLNRALEIERRKSIAR